MGGWERGVAAVDGFDGAQGEGAEGFAAHGVLQRYRGAVVATGTYRCYQRDLCQEFYVEFFGKAFDLNQTIVGLPNGTYKVSVNAFYRFGSTAEDWAKYSKDPNTQGNAYLYATSGAETKQTSIALLSSGACEDNGFGGTSNIEGTELYVPNDMVSANLYFQALDAYKNDVIVKVVDNELTIGIKLAEEDVVTNNWVILDNWKLTYYGENSNPGTGVEGVEVANPAKVEIYNVNGMKTKGFSKGVNIVKMTSKDGAVKFSKVNVK